jgi:hypothetical protein
MPAFTDTCGDGNVGMIVLNHRFAQRVQSQLRIFRTHFAVRQAGSRWQTAANIAAIRQAEAKIEMLRVDQ